MFTPAVKKAALATRFLVAATFIFFSQFYNLGGLSFRIWDEARLITSAYEMAYGGNIIVPAIHGRPDMWNTKPPLMVWSQAISIHLLGFSEFSARLPSAICGVLTMLLVAWLVYKVTRNGWAAVAGIIILATAQANIISHGTRQGEYDSMLTFFTTCSFVALYRYAETAGKTRNQALVLFFIALALAVLTKSIAGLLFTPAFFIYLVIRKQVLSTLKNPNLYLGLLIFMVLVFGYYALREMLNPGYLQAVYENELGGRFNGTIEGHGGPWDFYWQNLKTFRFGSWYWTLPGTLIALVFTSRNKLRRLMAYSLLTATAFIVLISISKTKLNWYDLPVYPLLAINGALLISWGAQVIAGKLLFLRKQTVALLLLIIFSIQPTYELYAFLKNDKDDLQADSFYALSYYLRDKKNKVDLNGVTCSFKDYALQWDLYTTHLRRQGVNIIDGFTGANSFSPGDKVITNSWESEKYFENTYETVVVDSFYSVRVYKIIAERQLR